MNGGVEGLVEVCQSCRSRLPGKSNSDEQLGIKMPLIQTIEAQFSYQFLKKQDISFIEGKIKIWGGIEVIKGGGNTSSA